MAKLKKIDPEWSPAENRFMKVGDMIEITDYAYLVRTQKAVLVDEQGNEMALPDETFTCPICYVKVAGTLQNFTNHVNDKHQPKVVQKTSEPVGTPTTSEPKEETVEPEDSAAKQRITALAKARANKTN